MYYNENRVVLRLLSRNEGKLKEYKSCNDLRAWSHDSGTRCRYLKEWIKSDMPRCIVPPSVLTQILLRMSDIPCGKAIPRCSRCCKSRLVLESIYETCEVIRDLLLEYQDFEVYFQEEEYETSHWPCERCVEPLKSVTMFWKLMSDKIFQLPEINCTKIKDMPINNKSNVRNVVKNWQTEMIDKINNAKKYIYSADIKKDIKEEGVDCSFCDFRTQGTCTKERKPRKVSRYASVRVKTNDKDTDAPEFLCKMILHYEQRLDFLEQQITRKDKEIESLITENECLQSKVDKLEKKIEQTKTKRHSQNYPKGNTILAAPYGEACISMTEIESEMVITMKKCADKNFKHVSVLQVLHKSNQPVCSELDLASLCQKKEDPMELLRKVQSAFGMFVRREMVIAKGRRSAPEKVHIDASSTIMKSKDSEQCMAKEKKNKVHCAQFLTDIETSSNYNLLCDAKSDIETFTCCTSTVTCCSK